ncbi:MAG: 3(2), 5-bisphosphate nucleotidase [Frankiales bacterium]|nr:3(2), 5-bisphosphate nucleotidase [Frankiales bacterium]
MISDDELALALATESGQLLLDLRETMGFEDPAALRDAGDSRSHELLMRRFAAERPDDAVLSEEGADDPVRLTADRVWIVDPLDGTREYGEPGRSDWAVHVALWVRGPGLTVGAVALPAAGDPLATLLVPGEQPSRAPYQGQPRIVVSRTRAPDWVSAVAGRIGAVTVPMGSAGAKIAAVIRGDAEAYLHSGGQYEWDSAAPVAVALAAGLWCSRLDGTPLAYNEVNPYLPDLVVCRADLAPTVLAAVAELA